MAFKLAEAFVELSAKGFGGVDTVIDRTTGKFNAMGAAIAVGSRLLGAIGLGVSVVGMVKAAAEAESTAISFEVLLGSATAAKKMLQELNDFAATTPFDFPGLSGAAKTLLSFGVDAGEIMDNIRMISDVAQGDSQKLGSLALVLGQISSAGKLTGGDLLQLVNAGFNPLQVISEKTGESVASLRDKMSDGQISFAMVKDAFKTATSEGGLFFQMNEKQSRTLTGLWSTLADNIGMGLRDTGTAIVEAFNLKGALSGVIAGLDMVQPYFQSFLSVTSAGVRFVVDSIENIGSGLVTGLGQLSRATGLTQFFTSATSAGQMLNPLVEYLFNDLLPSGIRLFDALKSAAENFWEGFLGSASDAADSIVGLWQSFAVGGGVIDAVISAVSYVGETLISVIDTLAFLVKNWDLTWDLLVANAGLALVNMVTRIQTWGINAIEIGMWFFENWKSIFVTLGDFTVAVFRNLAQNIQAALQPAQTSIAEMMLRASAAVMGTSAEELEQQIATLHEDAARRQVPFTGLLEGFQSSITQMPTLTEAAVQKTTDVIDGLQEELNQRAIAQGFGVKQAPNFRDQVAKAFEEPDAAGKKKATATASGKAGQIVSLSQLSSSVQQAAVKKAEQFAEKTANATEKLASAVGPGGKLKVEATTAVVGP